MDRVIDQFAEAAVRVKVNEGTGSDRLAPAVEDAGEVEMDTGSVRTPVTQVLIMPTNFNMDI